MKKIPPFLIVLLVAIISLLVYLIYTRWNIIHSRRSFEKQRGDSNINKNQASTSKNDSLFDSDEIPLKHEGKIVKRFHEMEADFRREHKNMTDKNDQLLTVLGTKYIQAHMVTVVSDSFQASIESLKNVLEKQPSGFSKNVLDDLYRNIKETGQNMLAQLENTKDRNTIIRSSDFIKDDPEVILKSLHHAPLAVVMVMLTKIQNDCMILESEILQSLAKSLD